MRYPIVIEVAGPLAMFARPDTGATPTSYPAPTWSACRGIFESIALLRDGRAWMAPLRVEIGRTGEGGRVRYQSYTTNYGGPLRKAVLVRGGSGMQLSATVLADVRYRIHGEVRGERAAGGTNPRHHLQEMFLRRLRRGQCFQTPALGWREFTCSYWGEPRDSFQIDTQINETIPSMLTRMWDRDTGGSYAPQYAHDVRIEQGVLHYAE